MNATVYPIPSDEMTGVPPSGPGSRASHEAASASSPEASIPNATMQSAFVILYDAGHRTLAVEVAREVGIIPPERGWFSHPDEARPVAAEEKLLAVLWRQGGVHSWGIPCRADDFTDKQWTEIAAYRLASAIEARSDATGTGAAEGESATAESGDAR